MTIYQGTKVPPHRYLDYTNIGIYTIQIASKAHRLSHSKTPNLKMMKKNAVLNKLVARIMD